MGSSQVQRSTLDNFIFSPIIVLTEQFLQVADIVVFYGLVALHELWMWQADVPTLEGLNAFEQWSCWVATGLVLLATIINWSLGKMSKARAEVSATIQPRSLEAGDDGAWNGVGGASRPSVVQ